MSRPHNLLTPNELDCLPYSYTDPYSSVFQDANGDYTIYFATWGPFCVWSADNPDSNWHINQPVELDIHCSHFLQVYPGLEHLLDTKIQNCNFTGTYQGKDVHWSCSQSQWTYLNHKPVIFIESEEVEVTHTLDTAQQTIQHSIQRLSPSSHALPRTLPNTPTPAPVLAQLLSRPTSKKGKACASSLSHSPTPIAGPSSSQTHRPQTPTQVPTPPPPRSPLCT